MHGEANHSSSALVFGPFTQLLRTTMRLYPFTPVWGSRSRLVFSKESFNKRDLDTIHIFAHDPAFSQMVFTLDLPPSEGADAAGAFGDILK